MFSGVATQFSVDTVGRCSLITMSSANDIADIGDDRARLPAGRRQILPGAEVTEMLFNQRTGAPARDRDDAQAGKVTDRPRLR